MGSDDEGGALHSITSSASKAPFIHGSFERGMLDPSSSQQHTNRISGWSALGKLSPAPRRKLVHLRRQAGRYACLVRNRRAAQHQGVPHAGGAPCCGFLELRKCCGREHANEQASHCNHSDSNSDHYYLPRNRHALCVIGPILPLESCDHHHVFVFFVDDSCFTPASK
jgi:hypothetical protein